METLNEILKDFTANLRQTGLTEYIAAITGLLSVWFARNKNILVYPLGIVSVTLYCYLMYRIGFYANSLINFIYLVMSIYGWYYWRKNRDDGAFVAGRIPLKNYKYYLAGMAVLFSLFYILLKKITDNPYFFWDAMTTSIFILAMWMMARKKAENWLAWIAGDLVCVPLFFLQGLVLTSLQYLVFLVIAVSGYLSWKKQ